MAYFWKQVKTSLQSLKNSLQRLVKLNNAASDRNDTTPQVQAMRKRIAWQAGLAGLTVVLTVVIVFAMTAAWYTNIVHTDGLTFEAAAWGFKGTIKTHEEPIQAGPGDEGNIHLEVQNESENVAAVSVNVSKPETTDGEMEKRLYFYVDTKITRNGETMERVYLNSQENYTYTLFSNTPLTLTDTVHNDARLKWHWVYDVLGYYVLGTADETGKFSGKIEYLRPIEYDLDAATITDDTYEIVTVDGETTAEDFLVALSKTDGYEGEIDPDQKLATGYYPVSVDEEGYGVYAYLCNYGEIEMATNWDTLLGQAAAAGEETGAYTVKLTIAAQKSKASVYTASTLADLKTAITMENVDVIKLGGPINIPDGDMLVLQDGQKVMIDLGGHTITGGTSGAMMLVNDGSALTLTNGTLTAPKDNNIVGIQSMGGEVTLSNIVAENFYDAITVVDYFGTQGLDSKIRIVNSTVTAQSSALFVKGNGAASSDKTQVIIENSTLSGEEYGIVGNGNLGNGTATDQGRYGTDIQVLNSVIQATGTQYGAAIYHPQKDSDLTIYNSTLTGYNGVVIKGGSVKIINSVIEGNGAEPHEPTGVGSGYTDTADAVYIETNYDYPIRLEIYNETATAENGLKTTKLTSKYGLSLQVFEENDAPVIVQIFGGFFQQEQPLKYLATGAVQAATGDGFYQIGIPEEEETP